MCVIQNMYICICMLFKICICYNTVCREFKKIYLFNRNVFISNVDFQESDLLNMFYSIFALRNAYEKIHFINRAQ